MNAPLGSSIENSHGFRSLSTYLLYTLLIGTSLVLLPDVTDESFFKLKFFFVVGFGLSALFLYKILSRGIMNISFSSIHILVILFTIASAVSLLHASNLGFATTQLGIIAVSIVILMYSEHVLDPYATILMILILTAITCGIALCHYVIPETFLLSNLARQLSTVSTFGNSSYFAGFLAAVLPLAIIQILLDRDTHPIRQALFVLLTLVIVQMLIVTESRSAWVAGIFSVIVVTMLSIKSMKARFIALGMMLVAILIVWFMFPSIIQRRIEGLLEVNAKSSLVRRMFFYEGAWKAFLSSPIIGNGVGNFVVFIPKFRAPEYWMFRSEDIVPHAHNVFLEILSETGILGGICFSLVLIFFGKLWISALKTLSGNARLLNIGFGASLCAIIIDNLFSINLYTTPVLVLSLMMMGSSLSMTKDKRYAFSYQFPSHTRILRFFPILVWLGYFTLTISSIPSQYESQANFLEGSLLRARGEVIASTEKLARAIEQDPSLPEARIYLASNLIDEGKYHEAQEHVEHLLRNFPWYPKAKTLLAICCFELGDTAKAFASMREELRIENSPQTLYIASTFSKNLQRTEEERSFIMQLLEENVQSGMSDFADEGVKRLAVLCDSTHPQQKCLAVLKQLREKYSSDVSLLLTIAEAYKTFELPNEVESTLTSIQFLPEGDAHSVERLHAIQDWVATKKTSSY